MEYMRLLQQRALRQIIQSRPLRSRHVVRQVCSNSSTSSTSPQQCFRSQRKRSPAYCSVRGLHPRTPFLPSRIPKPTRRFQSTQTSGPSPSSDEAALSLSQRMRKLSREYGYAALGVYLAFTAIDLPFCYLAVLYLGTERIARWEHAILSYVKQIISWPMGKGREETVDGEANYTKRGAPSEEVQGQTGKGKGNRMLEETYALEDHGYVEAEKANRGENASVWTKLALAYAIHKSFIFVRVPLTAAVTPKVVKTLRSWGWKIGKMPTKKVAPDTGINTGKSGVLPRK